MSEAALTIHSPLSLLREWTDRSDRASLREVIVTGYTLDLAFLERHLISPARGHGARITVLSDPNQTIHEPVDIRHAGSTYQHGYVHCAGAFHPKLLLLVGDEDVWAAIGSGNPTMSGWGHNHELWVVLRGSRATGPRAQEDLAEWLVALSTALAMPSWIADTVSHVGQMIAPQTVEGSWEQWRILNNLEDSLFGQLPTGSVDYLGLHAPFLDPRSEAVRRLTTRLLPSRLEVAVQPNLAQYDGASLIRAAVDASNLSLWLLDEQRTRHGKLIEWGTGDSLNALVGSANLSAAALLRAAADGGNCELVAICPVAESLLPRERSGASQEVQERNTIPEREHSESGVTLTLLGARRAPEGIEVELRTSWPTTATIETSPGGTPGTWMPVHTVSCGEEPVTRVRFQAPEQTGGAVRAYVDSGGSRVVSSVVFLTNINRCLPRVDDDHRPKLRADYRFEEVVQDADLAARFQADLDRLMRQVKERAAQPAGSPASQTSRTEEVAVTDRWGAWLQNVESVLGPSLANFIFPGAVELPGASVSGWSVGPEPDSTELSEGESEEIVDELISAPAETDVAQAPEVPRSQRQYWRNWLGRLGKAVCSEPQPHIEIRMVAARLYLDLLAAGIWGSDDSWRNELSKVAQALAPSEDEYHATPSDGLEFLGSMVAACLALLWQETTLHGGNTQSLALRRTWERVGEWAAFGNTEMASEYLYEPKHDHARVASASEVYRVIEFAETAADDPNAELYQRFAEEGLDVEQAHGVWIIDGSFRNPRLYAARVATLIDRGCAVLARNSRDAAVVLRRDDSLVLAETTYFQWRTYRLMRVSNPQSVLGSSDLPRALQVHELEPVPEHVATLADALGADLDWAIESLRQMRSSRRGPPS